MLHALLMVPQTQKQPNFQAITPNSCHRRYIGSQKESKEKQDENKEVKEVCQFLSSFNFVFAYLLV